MCPNKTHCDSLTGR